MGGARRVVGVWVLVAATVMTAAAGQRARHRRRKPSTTAFSVLQDATVSLPVLQNDVLGQGGSNPSNAPARVTATSGSTAQGGSYVCLNGGGTCSYTAPAGFLGTDSFEYRIGFRFGSFPGTWVPTDIGLVTVTVVANEPPTAVDDADTVRGTGQLVTYVVPNDTDPNLAVRGERLSVVPGPATSVEGGTVECGTGTDLHDCVYIAPPGFLGVDSYEYTVVDRLGLSDVGTVTVTVTPNLPPTANDDSGTVVYAWYFNGVSAPAHSGSLGQRHRSRRHVPAVRLDPRGDSGRGRLPTGRLLQPWFVHPSRRLLRIRHVHLHRVRRARRVLERQCLDRSATGSGASRGDRHTHRSRQQAARPRRARQRR